MMIQSEKRIFHEDGKAVPICTLDTETRTVKSLNNVSMRKKLLEAKYIAEDEDATVWNFSNAKGIGYHIDYVIEHCPEKFTQLVNENKIFDYLWELWHKITEAVDLQVELWKETDEDYRLAKQTGDWVSAAKIERMLDMQAQEMVFPRLVYQV